MCLFQLWCLIVNYQSGLDLRWDICSCNSRGQMSGGEETKGLNLKEQQEERKRRWEGGKKKKSPEAFSLWISYLLFANKVGWECFKLAEVCRQSSPIKGSTCCSGVPGTAAAPLDQPGIHLRHHREAVLSPFPVKHLGSALCLALSQAGERPAARNCCQIVPVMVAWRGRGGVGVNQNIHMAKPSLTLSPLMPSAPAVPAAPSEGNKTPCWAIRKYQFNT